MNKNLNVTYVLKTNPAQYQFLKKEMEKTRIMYETIRKEKQRCQSEFCEQQKIKGYAKRFLPLMSQAEMRHMLRCIRDDKAVFTYEQVLDQRLKWRGVNLFQMMLLPYEWMKEPLLKHWFIKRSRLYERNSQLYLHIVFDQDHNITENLKRN